jgi:hypothetical protein
MVTTISTGCVSNEESPMSNPIPVRLVNFHGITQAQFEWCWTAVTASIYNYYGARATPPRQSQPQCVFVRDQFKGLDGCLRNPRPGTCLETRCFDPSTSMPGHLNIELRDYDLLDISVNCDGTDTKRGEEVFHGGFDWHEVRTNIDAGRPIGLRVMVSFDEIGPISHFLVVIGYYPIPGDRIVIWDPFLGEKHITFEELAFLYGPPEQKYLTKQASSDKYKVNDPKARRS